MKNRKNIQRARGIIEDVQHMDIDNETVRWLAERVIVLEEEVWWIRDQVEAVAHNVLGRVK